MTPALSTHIPESRTGPAAAGAAAGERAILQAMDVSVHYGPTAAVRNVTLDVPERRITAIIGPSGCGKSTLLRSFNRMNDFIPGVAISGRILLEGQDVYGDNVDPAEVRRHVGMVFQKPNPFPKSIFKNVAWGPKINGYKGDLNELVEGALRKAALWDEVKDKLDKSGYALSGGQQQRLCIARAIAMQPRVILMDEPASALDPVSTARIEDLMLELKKRYTIVIVTHNMQQAARISDYTAFMNMGELVEVGVTQQVFTKPRQKQTEEYVTGRFG